MQTSPAKRPTQPPGRRAVPGKGVVTPLMLWHDTVSSCSRLICAASPACLTEGHNRHAGGGRQLNLSVPFGEGDDDFQVLWQDGEHRVFCRGWRTGADGNRRAVLAVLPA